MVNSESGYREPTYAERSLFDRLLQAEFPGKEELVSMMRKAAVRTLDEDGGLEIHSPAEGKAPVVKRVPVEAQAKDEDGGMIHALLHVVEGRPIELEIYKEDGSRIKRMPQASEFELIVLPTAPNTTL